MWLIAAIISQNCLDAAAWPDCLGLCCDTGRNFCLPASITRQKIVRPLNVDFLCRDRRLHRAVMSPIASIAQGRAACGDVTSDSVAGESLSFAPVASPKDEACLQVLGCGRLLTTKTLKSSTRFKRL